MAEYHTNRSVFEASLDRIRHVYQQFDEVVVAMSGGKDSTVVFELTKIVAKELGKLPVKVFWLDQECEWQATVDYMKTVMHDKDVKPYWFQIPFQFTNSCSNEKDFMDIWNISKRDLWCHDYDECSIKIKPDDCGNTFETVIDTLHKHCFEPSTKNGAILCGIRAQENVTRRLMTSGNKRQGWIMPRNKESQSTKVYPIWDWLFQDIWTAIAKNHWNYNKIYDYQYQYGLPKNRMRVSALIHETGWKSIEMLQEFEPQTYDRFARRINGVSTINHMKDQDCDLSPKELPYMFKDWKEYRDYLLENMVKPEYWEIFRKRWKNQNDDEWYKIHTKEVIVNDIEGKINHEYCVAKNFKRIAKERRKNNDK